MDYSDALFGNGDFYVGGARKKTRKSTATKTRKPRKPSEYNKFVQHYMLQGMPMAQAAALWRQTKRR